MRIAVSRCLAVALLFALAGCPSAAASSTQETIIQDDPLLLSASDQGAVDAVFTTFREIGIDRVRVSLFWDHVAPERQNQTKPMFPEPGPSSPDAYPTGSWDRYDRIVLGAKKAGIGLLFSVTGPGPAWATEGVRCRKAGPFRGCEEGVFRPDPAEFRDFVTAAGTRYSGSYQLKAPPEPDDGDMGLPGLDDMGDPPMPPPVTLPRVDHWSVWNEPNFPAWLLPIWQPNRPKTAADMVAASPHHYRSLVDAAFAGFDATGHGSDTILIGETAPRGAKNPRQLRKAMMPAEFARELYCLSATLRPYSGRAAAARGCPATPEERSRFTTEHAGLFRAQGWAHHPYSLDSGTWRVPTWRHELRDNVAIGNLDTLTRTLDAAAAAWRHQGPPKSLWMTEYGYQTTPPDPTAGVAPARQGRLGAWGEFLAYRNPRVASFAQFLLFDDRPLPELPENDPSRWVTWQSGLYSSEGVPKPHLEDFRLPVHVAQRGRTARVFGTYRPLPTATVVDATVEFAAPGRQWRVLSTTRVSNLRGYVQARVRVPRAGRVRLVWKGTAPADPRVPTRAVRVR